MPLSHRLLEKHPIFRNFLAATTISQLGSAIFDIAMPLYVWERTHSAMGLSLVAIGLHLPYFLMAPLTGYCVDHFDKRKVMLLSDVGQVVMMLLLILNDFRSSLSVWPLFFAIFVAKTCMLVFETVGTFQLIPALVPEETLSGANTWFLSAQRLIQILGPLSGGVMMSYGGFRICILVNLLSFGATLYFVFGMKNLSELIHSRGYGSQGGGPMTTRAVLGSFLESVRYIWKSPVFRPFVYLMFFWNLSSLCPGTPSLTYYFCGLKHFSAARYGVVVSLVGLFSIAGFAISDHIYQRFDFFRSFVGGCWFQAIVASVSVLFFGYPGALAVIFALSRGGSSIVSMGTFLLRQTEVPKSQIGAVNASIRMFFMIAAPLSAYLQGILITKYGVGVSFALGALCLFGAGWYAQAVGTAYETLKASDRMAA
jgi:MFS transporter, DHA3 family, macrolide efflux protein